MRLYGKIFFYIICLLLLLLSAGCGAYLKQFGRIIPESGATQAFETYQVDFALRYYISGSDAFPNAIIGLHRTYSLDSTLWKQVEMTSPRLRDLVENMQSMERPQFGFTLFDNRGNRIGVWYSILTAPTSIRMVNDHTVAIPTPDLDTYESFHKGGSDREE